ncbi:MAG: acetate--CoA ligase family protein, partial [Acidobacteria bacterium]|nr:acetate--CoA ligase family protein [Acidobacteriota bacterium]
MSTVDCESLLETAVRRARAEGRATLLEHEAYGFLPLLGLTAPRHRFVPAAADPAAAAEDVCASLDGDRVVLKIVAAGVLHKTELGGVVFVERSAAPVRAAIETLLDRFSEASGILAAEMVPFDAALGSELLLGIRGTEDFGPIVTFGIGG